jgi:hypothetical protein
MDWMERFFTTIATVSLIGLVVAVGWLLFFL